MMKKTISLLLSTALCLCLMPLESVSAADTDSNFKGSGTESDPFQIDSAYRLRLLSELVNDPDFSAQYRSASYIQTADIDLAGVDWDPIGNFWDAAEEKIIGYTFLGSYNGNYHKITNLTCKADKDRYIGLFGRISGGEKCTISNLSVYGSISSTGVIGGIVGEVYGGSTVRNCSFSGTINGGYAIGGITGYIWNGGTIQNCYVNGIITADSETSGSSGGLVGGVNAGNGTDSANANISNSYFTGKVNGLKCGGVAGYAKIAEAKPECTITFDNVYYLNSANKGAVTETSYTGCSALSEALLKSANELLGSPFLLDTDNVNDGYPIFEWQSAPYQFKGSGTKEDPYQISNIDELKAMRDLINSEYSSANYRGCYYIQTADIDLNHELWEPIAIRELNGKEAGLLLTGHYDGQGHTISNLYVNYTHKFAGLFGCVAHGGSIENLIVTGTVISNSPSVGGVVGEVCNNGASIKNCAFIGDVTGSTWGTGGVVGTLWQKGIVTNCYHNGSVSNSTEHSTGGVVGYIAVAKDANSDAVVSNCYHVGKISGAAGFIGNIAGSCEFGTGFTGTINIQNCYMLKDEGVEAINGQATVCEVLPLSENLLKKAYEDLGTAYIENTTADLNDGYPLLAFQTVQTAMLCGDVNLDDMIDVSDAVLLARLLAQDSEAVVSSQGKLNADTNKDGSLTSNDVILILKYIARIITAF